MDAREENEDAMDRNEVEMQDNQHIEENNNQDEQKDEEMQDVNTRSEISVICLSDDDEVLLLGHDRELDLESTIKQKPLSEEEISEWISELVGVESTAAETQEALEKESLAKVDGVNKECIAGPSELDWSSLNKVCTEKRDEAVSFGSKNWASVYSASTPQQAAAIGLEFPGVNNEVEEIEDASWADTFFADAKGNEKELALTEEQKKKHMRVQEEDDINTDRQLQLLLNQKRRKTGSKQVIRHTAENSGDDSAYLDENPTIPNLAEDQVNCPETSTKSQNNEVNKEESGKLCDSDVDKMVPITAVNADTMRDDPQNISNSFRCTVCNNVAVEVQTHPHLQVIVCMDCKRSIEDRLAKGGEDSLERYCEWCGHISDLIDCRSCEKHFCASCIKRNIGDECLSEAQSYGWDCCCCAPLPLQRLTLELEKAIGGDNKSSSDIADVNVAIRYRTYSSMSNGKNVLRGAEALGDAHSGYIVNVVRETGEEAVRIPPSISSQLKDHQVTGIRFMWENIVQSINGIKSGDKGLGCILAHTMGLGKTFQVIAFLYTAMRCVDLGLKTALIVTPVNVLHNWRNEFMKWMPSEVKPLHIFMLEDVSREMRLDLLKKWRSKGGVLLLGYATFRNLSLGKGVKDINAAREIFDALTDGPDILVCDEAQIIKNTRADTTKALKQVRCQRRIALTGSPLQNNLMEYYCMVDFVREGLLGSSPEFRNRLVFHTIVSVPACAHRELYKRFIELYGISDGRTDERMRKNFFAAYQVLAQILNHPGIPQLRREGRIDGHRASIVEIPDDCSSDEDIDCNMVVGEKQRTMSGLQDEVDGYHLPEDWYVDLLDKTNYKESDYSGKMILLLDLLSMCADVDDKALVFSQSIPTLDLIELYLSRLPRYGKQGKFWKKGKDWYRIDGKTEISERQKLLDRFNEPENKRVKCILISTRAGSLGINLYAANRVIIVDGSWNPTYDLQAIHRAWRYGQKKPVFAYRLMARGTIEEKIYKRQVTKEGLAARVVDRQQVHGNISKEEMLHLFEFDEAADGKNTSPKQKVGCCSDKLMENLLHRHNPNWIFSFHEHETLLKENEEEKLTKKEKDMACQHVPVVVQKPSPSPQTVLPRQLKRFNKSRFVHRNCTRIAHQRTLLSQGIKVGSSTVCGECGLVITWEGAQRVAPELQKPSPSLQTVPRLELKSYNRSRFVFRNCTRTAHQRTLISQGRKVGSSTVCGGCGLVITWEDVTPARLQPK
ncbi:hypothetical protein Bca4012_008715 [Brassica carinata]